MCGSFTVSVLISMCLFASFVECRPYYRWFDYDYFAPQAKPIQEAPSVPQPLGTVSPLRPYEPWVLDCHLLFHDDKIEVGKRHPRCKEVDDTNEKEYAKFLLHVQRWEEAYPDRAERWNNRFPDARENEKKKYAELKAFAESHILNVETTVETIGLATTASSQRTKCTNNANCQETGNNTNNGRNEQRTSEQTSAGPKGPVITQ